MFRRNLAFMFKLKFCWSFWVRGDFLPRSGDIRKEDRGLLLF